MQEAKVTAKDQTTFPRDVRLALGLEARYKLCYIVEDGRVQMLKTRHVHERSGLLYRIRQRTVSPKEINEAIV